MKIAPNITFHCFVLNHSVFKISMHRQFGKERYSYWFNSFVPVRIVPSIFKPWLCWALVNRYTTNKKCCYTHLTETRIWNYACILAKCQKNLKNGSDFCWNSKNLARRIHWMKIKYRSLVLCTHICRLWHSVYSRQGNCFMRAHQQVVTFSKSKKIRHNHWLIFSSTFSYHLIFKQLTSF